MTSAGRRLAFAGSVAGASVVALDGTVLTVAQPTLQRDLDASFAQVQWTSTGYLIAVAGLLVFAGRLGDRYGHRRTFGIGMLGFGAVSAGIALAPGVGWVIGLRVVQGVFGALLQPATLGMLRAAFPPDRLRLPIAVRTAAIGLAAAAGPIAGGALVTSLGWRAVFFVNVGPALVFGALALAVRGRPEHPQTTPVRGQPKRPQTTPAPRPPEHPQTAPVRLDLPGALLLAVSLACLVHALVALPQSGWTPARGLGLGASAVAAAAFVRHERRTPAPLVPADVVGAPAIGSALGILVAASAALHGTLFTCAYFLQNDLGLDPFHSALVSLPLAALMVAAAPGCAVLLRRCGARRTTVAAAVVLALGILVLWRASATPVLCAGFALLGAGFGTVMMAGTHVVVQQTPVESAGVAGGLKQTAMNVGPVLGVAVAAACMSLGGSRSPLLVLAVTAAAGAVAGRALPVRSATAAVEHRAEGARSRIPTRP
ncbi:MFS transporter [Streptomyces sp. NPDC002088]|uniref:MFS transporter n=1 Tax=Streptomyces sp. NPDC002088 TaxID=3154665 RepID=UPI00331F3FF3